MVGIYCIRNLKNNRVYVGQSIDVERRLSGHLKALIKGVHENSYLQRSFNKHGESNFVFTLIEECLESELNDKEIFWIKEFGGSGSSSVYNCTDGGDGIRGFKHTEDTKSKIQLSEKGKIVSEETRRKISEAKKNPSLETRQKMRDSHRGKKLSAETRQKISDSCSGLFKVRTATRTDETRRKLSEAAKKRKLSEETKRKIGDSVRKTKQNKKEIII